MIRLQLSLPLAITAVLGLLSACGGSAETLTASSPTVRITAADLPNLVLDMDEVSVDGTVLPYDHEDSGPQSKSDYTEEGFDTEWWAETLEKYNWQAGYYQDFGIGGGTSPVFNASVLLDLYDSPDNAAEALAERLERIPTWEGQSYDGATLESVALFEIEELGAWGVTVGVRLSTGKTFTMTNIDFVRGPMIVDVGTASLDQRDLVPATQELALMANARLIAAGFGQA